MIDVIFILVLGFILIVLYVHKIRALLSLFKTAPQEIVIEVPLEISLDLDEFRKEITVKNLKIANFNSEGNIQEQFMIKVVYSPKVLSDTHEISPSAVKPKMLIEYLQQSEYKDIIEIVEPEPVCPEDMYQCHERSFIDDVLALKRANGFGTFSKSVADSLPHTNGAMYTAAKLALNSIYPTCAAVAGFHHSGYAGWEGLGYFCTFNGLMIAATKLVADNDCDRVMIVDCDMHWGNGTDNILEVIDPKRETYRNISFGKYFDSRSSSKQYLEYFDEVRHQAKIFKPSIIIYQSGADVHIHDPFIGLLTEEEMYERDLKMFSIARDLAIPITWTLAGGYQRDADGGCSYVIKLHANTFKAVKEVYYDKTGT